MCHIRGLKRWPFFLLIIIISYDFDTKGFVEGGNKRVCLLPELNILFITMELEILFIYLFVFFKGPPHLPL